MAGAAALVVAGSGVAVADFVVQSVGASGTTTVALENGTATTTISYWIDASGPCDISAGNPATVTVRTTGGAGLVIDNPDTATVGDATMTFTGCGTSAGKRMRLTADRAGSWAMDAESTAGINTATERDNYTFTATAPANTRPTVTLGGVEDGASYELGAVPAATCEVTDAEDGSSAKAASLSDVTGGLSGQGLGEQTATCTHTDSGGLAAEPASATYSIVDTTDPTLDGVPADQLLEATGPGGAVATWDRPTATDAGGLAAGSPSCAPASGTTFKLGTTEVTCSATDLSGNATTGTFEVTVTDTEGPVITGGSGATKEATGPLTAVDFTEPTAYDVVDEEVPVTCDPASGSEFAVGVHTVTCTAADGTGNAAASVQLEVVVTDTTGPVIDVADVTGVEATGPGGAPVDYSASATDLVDGTVEVTCTPASGETFPLGTTTVTCDAEDSRGNPASESFEVEVVDTTAPTLTVPEDRFLEATGPDGAVADFAGGVSATDAVDTDVVVSCVPESGSRLGFGPTTVTCTAVDDAGNDTEKSFVITVRDTTGPAVTVPDDIVEEATGPDGAEVAFAATASDLVDGAVPVTCVPASGDTFPLGTTPVTCSAEDSRGNAGSDTFDVTVQDTTAPELTVPDDITAEATGPDGAEVPFEATATDLVDGDVEVTCDPAGGTTFALGVTEVSCEATDAAGNTGDEAFTVTVEDTTGPTVTVPTGRTAEATGPDGATVEFAATATDLVDGAVPVTCDPQSGWRFLLGTTPVTCTATDRAGNTGVGVFDVLVVDTTAPELTLPEDIATTATSAAGRTVTWQATATDVVDGDVEVTCDPASGSTFAPGTTTVTCTAADEKGNAATGSFDVTVTFDWSGFFAPVDNGPVANVIKGGQSVPLKWRISDGAGGYVSSLAVVSGVKQSLTDCSAASGTDVVEAPTSGQTSLRYDTTAQQYVYNWQSPKTTNRCYRVTVALTDGTTHSALFRTK